MDMCAAPPMRVPAPSPSHGTFTDLQFNTVGASGRSQHHFMLFEPSVVRLASPPMLVFLHGCQQGAADFAAGTRMNEAAQDAGIFVLYPQQELAANVMRCWNWYAPTDESGRAGDAALIAALTRYVMEEHGIDPTRVYVAGLSAGGAMAAVLAQDYPGLFAALGVHSGLPPGHAIDLRSALRLMSDGPGPRNVHAPPRLKAGDGRSIRSIVFHGDRDTTVHMSNGQAIHACALGSPRGRSALRSQQTTTGPLAGRRGFTRLVQIGARGVTEHELWVVHGAGHAWAGGSVAQKYTDALGPDASGEMLRFFLQHRLDEGFEGRPAVPGLHRKSTAEPNHVIRPRFVELDRR